MAEPFRKQTFFYIRFGCKYSYNYALEKHHKYVWPKLFPTRELAQAWIDAWNWSYRFRHLAAVPGGLGEGGRGRVTSMAIEQGQFPLGRKGWEVEDATKAA